MVHAILHEHEQIRRRALPAVSVLVGPLEDGRAAWNVWLAQQGRATAVVSDRTPESWPLAWIELVLQRYDLTARAERYLLRQGQLRPSAVRSWRRNGTVGAASLLVPQFPADYGLSPAKLCRWLLERHTPQQSIDAAGLWERQQAWMQPGERRPGFAFQQVLAVLDDASAPALLVVAPPTGAARQDADAAAAKVAFASLLYAAKLAMAAPELTVGAAVEGPLWQRFLEQQPPSFSKALLTEHALETVGTPDETILPPRRRPLRVPAPHEAYAASIPAGV